MSEFPKVHCIFTNVNIKPELKNIKIEKNMNKILQVKISQKKKTGTNPTLLSATLLSFM